MGELNENIDHNNVVIILNQLMFAGEVKYQNKRRRTRRK